jgi:hypothetical protein
LTTGAIVTLPLACLASNPHSVPGTPNVTARLRDMALLRGLVDSIDELTGRARRRRLEEELVRADAEIWRLRQLLAEATRPPTQFARMREREVALRRLTRLRVAREGVHEEYERAKAG